MSSPYRPRFGVIFGVLVGIATVAIGLAFILTGVGHSCPVERAWSSWQPTGSSDLTDASQIAQHVANKYRLDDGEELDVIRSGPYQIQNLPFSVVIRGRPKAGDLQLIPGHGVFYVLSGLGPNGSIAGGKASLQRHALLRREALELALYTFHYRPDVDHVVALLPPAPKTGKATPQLEALFFRPGDLAAELGRPLTKTIAPATPMPKTLTAAQENQINNLTLSNLFKASFQQGQDAQAFMILDPYVS
jgi:hypothetical protein